MPTASRSLRPGSVADSGTGPIPSLADEGGRSPAAARCLLAAASFCRRSLAALVSGSLSLLAAAVSYSGMLVSHAPMLSVSLSQGALVSRLPATSGTVSGPEALVSRSLASPAASMFSGSLAGGTLAQLLSISLYCRVPITLQGCLSPSYPFTLVLRPPCTQLAWNTPGLASPPSLVGAGDQLGTQAASPPVCSSTPMLLPQECCEHSSFFPACAPAGVRRGNRALALSLPWLQCGASSHWFALLRLWVSLADRCPGPTRAQL